MKDGVANLLKVSNGFKAQLKTLSVTTNAVETSEDVQERFVKGADELTLVRSGLEDTMRTAYQTMHEVWRRRPDVPDLRTAGYLVSIDRVAQSYRAKGL